MSSDIQIVIQIIIAYRHSPLTEVHQIFSRCNFLINDVNATIHVAIHPPVVE